MTFGEHGETPGFVYLELARGGVERLEVDPDVMRHRAEAASADLLSERGGDAGGDPASYLGASDALIDLVLARWRKP